MKVTVAKNAGFCFGVKRATESLENALDAREGGERIYTLGTLIHNETYNQSLADRGVGVTDMGSIEEIVRSACPQSPVKVFVRAHGIPKEDEAMLDAYAKSNPYFEYVDCTCPFVKKIHRIAAEHSSEENVFLLLGSKTHPEVVGIMSYFEYGKLVFDSAESLESILASEEWRKYSEKTPILAAQTVRTSKQEKLSDLIPFSAAPEP